MNSAIHLIVIVLLVALLFYLVITFARGVAAEEAAEAIHPDLRARLATGSKEIE